MELLISVLIFINTSILVYCLCYYGLVRRTNPIVQRLASLKEENIYGTSPKSAAYDLKSRFESIVEAVGKFISSKLTILSSVRKKLIRAGYRNDNSVALFYGLKGLLAAFFVFLLYFVLQIKVYAGAITRAIAFKDFISLVIPQSFLFYFLLFMAGLLGYLLPNLFLNFKIRARQENIKLALPDVLDLLVICVEAGLGLDHALIRITEELNVTYPEISDELHVISLEVRAGKSRAEAFQSFAERVDVPDVHSLVAMLVQTDRFGTSLAQSLRVHSDSMRVKRRQRAEEAASKAPVKMVLVTFFFIFPAIFIVVLLPAVLRIAKELLPALSGN